MSSSFSNNSCLTVSERLSSSATGAMAKPTAESDEMLFASDAVAEDFVAASDSADPAAPEDNVREDGMVSGIFAVSDNGRIPGHALHEKSLQRQKKVFFHCSAARNKARFSSR